MFLFPFPSPPDLPQPHDLATARRRAPRTPATFSHDAPPDRGRPRGLRPGTRARPPHHLEGVPPPLRRGLNIPHRSEVDGEQPGVFSRRPIWHFHSHRSKCASTPLAAPKLQPGVCHDARLHLSRQPSGRTIRQNQSRLGRASESSPGFYFFSGQLGRITYYWALVRIPSEFVHIIIAELDELPKKSLSSSIRHHMCSYFTFIFS